jgi:hypothetical protein
VKVRKERKTRRKKENKEKDRNKDGKTILNIYFRPVTMFQ